MATNEEILVIANKLANQGKKPSVALIKSRLTSNTPLPVIISTLKVWQHEPDFVECASSSANSDAMTKDENVTKQMADSIKRAVAQELIPLTHEIAQLRAEIELLKQK